MPTSLPLHFAANGTFVATRPSATVYDVDDHNHHHHHHHHRHQIGNIQKNCDLNFIYECQEKKNFEIQIKTDNNHE